MYCPECGTKLSRPTKFCVRCGAALQAAESEVLAQANKRFDDYLEGMFWTTFLGLGLVLGGAVIFQQVLHFSRGMILAYLGLSGAAFLIIFGLGLWQTLRLALALKKPDEAPASLPARDTNKMLAAANDAPSSVIEHTTRSLKPAVKE
jgi:hypothetical protein